MTHATLIVATDAQTARFLIRPIRGAPLEEVGDDAIVVPKPVALAARRPLPAAPDLEAVEAVLDEGSAEHDFLHRLARLIDDQAAQKRFQHLVLCAPPHVLCILRDHVAAPTRQLLACEIAKDLASAPISAFEAHLDVCHV